MSVVSRYARIASSQQAMGVAFVFFANGFMFSNWVVRIPSVKDRLALNDAELGLALVFMAIGALIAMPVGGALIGRVGSGRIAAFVGALYVVLFGIVGLADTMPLLCAALFLMGLGNGAMDVAMNAQADAAEAVLGQRIMSFSHAMWSLGVALGTLPAGLFSAFDVPVSTHLFIVGAPLAAGLLFGYRFACPDRVHDGPPQPAFALPRGPLLYFGLICFCGAIIEGGMSDWIAVFTEDTMGYSSLRAAGAYGAFATAMFLARIAGDSITERFGAALTVRYGLAIAAVGLAVGLTGVFPLMVVGFFAVGLGIAGIFPAVFRAAGRLPGHAPGPAMAAAVTLGYVGFLLGPATIGFLAEATTLQIALLLLIPLCALGALLSRALSVSD